MISPSQGPQLITSSQPLCPCKVTHPQGQSFSPSQWFSQCFTGLGSQAIPVLFQGVAAAQVGTPERLAVFFVTVTRASWARSSKRSHLRRPSRTGTSGFHLPALPESVSQTQEAFHFPVKIFLKGHSCRALVPIG